MSSLKERLERLRAQAAAAEAVAREAGTEEAAAGGRDEAVGGGSAGLAAGGETYGFGTGDIASGDSLHPAFRSLGAEVRANALGTFIVRTVRYSFPYRHGWYGLEDIVRYASALKPMAARAGERKRSGWRAAGALEGELAEPRPEAGSIVFLDTETTGLGVGAGNLPFMIGIGYVDEGAFVVEQALIRDPGEERAMLHYLLERLSRCTHLATYNGRSFDWPVLAGRFILNGWRKSGAEPLHLDFLHPSRSLWRHTLPSCRLGTVEELRLGFDRGEDVPGAMAPELYARYLRDGDAGHLKGVFLHNEKDILTLGALAVHFGRLLSGVDSPPTEEPEELFRTAAWLDRHGRTEEAGAAFELLADRRDAPDFARTMALAARFRREGRYDRAQALWERAAEWAATSRLPRTDAHVALAIHCERRLRDIAAALRYAEAALALFDRLPPSPRDTQRRRREREALAKRVDRLRRKLAGAASERERASH